VSALIQSGIATAIGFGALVAGSVALEGTSALPTFNVAARFWLVVLFAVSALHIATVYFFNPRQMEILLPTPAAERDLFYSFRRGLGLGYLLIAFCFAFLAIPLSLDRPAIPPNDGPPGMWVLWELLYAFALFRFLWPVAMVAGMRLRKLVVPWGHVAVWLVAAGAIVGALFRLPRGGAHLGGAILLVNLRSGWALVGAAIGLTLLRRPVAAWCDAAAIRSLRREELLSYVYPFRIERAETARDAARGAAASRIRRRWIFVLQEATGLYHARDWWLAAVACLVGWGLSLLVFAWALTSPTDKPLAMPWLGSSSHTVVTMAIFAVTALAVIILGESRGVRSRGLRLFAVPISWAELHLTRVAALSVLYVVAGVLAGLGVVIVCPGSQPGLGTILAVGGENLLQVWMVGVCFSFFNPPPDGASVPRRAGVREVVFLLLVLTPLFAMVCISIGFPYPTRRAWQVSSVEWVRYPYIYCTYLLSSIRGGSSEETIDRTVRLYRSPPAWAFHVAILTALALALAYSFASFLRRARGLVPPSYGTGSVAVKRRGKFWEW
jgi:hypothetical protein